MELKIAKKCIFFKRGVSFGAAQVGKVEQTNVYFLKKEGGGRFSGAVQVEKVEPLGVGQAENMGVGVPRGGVGALASQLGIDA